MDVVEWIDDNNKFILPMQSYYPTRMKVVIGNREARVLQEYTIK